MAIQKNQTITKRFFLQNFLFLKKALGFSVFFSLMLFCSSTPPIEDVPFFSAKQKRFYSLSDKRSADLIARANRMESESKSYSGEFKMRIETHGKFKEKISLSGRVFYNKDGSLLKIQLMDSLFGLIVTQILSDPKQISIKSAGKDKLHKQPMDDIAIYDNKSRKNIIIPFPIIFYSLTLAFRDEFEKRLSYFSPEENRILVKRNNDEYQYLLTDTGIGQLEYFSKDKNIKAVALMSSGKKEELKSSHPPGKIITKVLNLSTDEEKNLIEINFSNIIYNQKFTPQTFHL